MPTLPGCNISGDWLGSPSLLYRCTQMDPEVGLLNPAISCPRLQDNIRGKLTSVGIKIIWINQKHTCNKVVFPLPLRPNINPKLHKRANHVQSVYIRSHINSYNKLTQASKKIHRKHFRFNTKTRLLHRHYTKYKETQPVLRKSKINPIQKVNIGTWSSITNILNLNTQKSNQNCYTNITKFQFSN